MRPKGSWTPTFTWAVRDTILAMGTPTRRQYQIYIERPVEAVFVFHADLKNHARLSSPEMPEEIIAGLDTPRAVGACITYRTRQGATARQQTCKLIQWDPPHGFAEEQVNGPFASWVHRRRFTAFQSGTLMADLIEYEPGAGPLGAIAERLWLGKHLDTAFRHRQNEAKRIMEQVGRIKGLGH